MNEAGHTDARVLVAAARNALARGERSAALTTLARAAEAFPKLSPVQVEFANLAFAQGEIARAEAAYRRAIATDPRDYAAHIGLGNVLRERGSADEAIACYRLATVVAPQVHACWYNLGLALREVGRYEDAMAAYDRALAIDPRHAATRYNRANALTAAVHYPEALASYDEALRLRPDYLEAIFSKSMTLLLKGDLAQGWDLYEARWRARTGSSRYRFAQLPQWQGEPLQDKRILVWGEQGVGDEIRFLSVIGDTLREAHSILYAGDARLAPLLARSFPGLTILPPEADDAPTILAQADLQSPVGSLARFRRRSLRAFPPPRPFLVADDGLRQVWRDWLAGTGPGIKIGVSWRTGRNARRKQARYAGLDAWGRFLANVPARFVCLQYDACEDDLAFFRDRYAVDVHVPPGLDRRDDFEGLAGLYAALDAIVSAPNTVADLAGALGVPCWVVAHAPHWPWGIWPDAGPSRQPWYFGLRMVDAGGAGGWECAFAEVAAALAAHR